MLELNNYNLTKEDLDLMLDLNPEISESTNEEIKYNLDILKAIGCSDTNITDIIVANPFYLSKQADDVIELIAKLKSLNFTNLNLLFDSNPFLLNKDAFEIDDYIKKELAKNKSLDEIVDEFEANPYLIDEE